jgi:hypothetical protein
MGRGISIMDGAIVAAVPNITRTYSVAVTAVAAAPRGAHVRAHVIHAKHHRRWARNLSVEATDLELLAVEVTDDVLCSGKGARHGEIQLTIVGAPNREAAHAGRAVIHVVSVHQ